MGTTKEIKIYDDRDNAVAELYALRAGLSVISQKVDEVRECERGIENERENIEDIKWEIDDIDGKIAREKGNLQKCDDELCKQKEQHEKDERASIYTFDDKHTPSLKISYIVMAGGIFFALPCLVVVIISCLEYDLSVAALVFFCIFAVVALSALANCLVDKSARKRYVQKIHDEKVMKIANDEQANKIKCEEIRERISALESEGPEIRKQKNAELKIAEDKIGEIKTDMERITQNIAVYSNVLEKTYAKLLNTADWKNIDLCIFYLQTGRADTIKECLLLVDRQRQNDEIVGAISAASNSICNEIRSGFSALGSTMVTCLNALSVQMETMSNTLSMQHDETVRALSSIEAKSAEVLSATQLNNALQDKANTSSEQLLNDYQYVQSQYGVYLYH